MSSSRPSLFKRPLSLDPVWMLLPIVGALVAAAFEPIPPYDYWWPIVAGRVLDQTGSIPRTNVFLYTLPADAPFVNQPWLGQWLMYQGQRWGVSANVLVRNMLLGCGWVVVVATLQYRAGAPRVAGILGMFAAMATFPVVSVRTRMFALVPFALLLGWLCIQVDERDRFAAPRLFAGLCVATVFWANSHGSFVLAPVLTGLVGGGILLERLITERTLPTKEIGIWGAAIAALVSATFVNPQGPRVYAYVAQLAVTSNVSSTVSEWAPPAISEAIGVYFLVLEAFYLTIMFIRRRHIKIWEAFLVLGVTYLGASAVRNLFWWSVTCAVVVAPHVGHLLRNIFSSTTVSPLLGRLNMGIVSCLVVIGLAVQPFGALTYLADFSTLGRSRRDGHVLLSYENAMIAVQALRSHGVERVFHDQAIGGLIEYALGEPNRQVSFVDQRMELIPESIWAEYFGISSAKQGWERRLDDYAIDGLILGIGNQTKLIQAALNSPSWTLSTLDEAHVAFVRTMPLTPTRSR